MAPNFATVLKRFIIAANIVGLTIFLLSINHQSCRGFGKTSICQHPRHKCEPHNDVLSSLIRSQYKQLVKAQQIQKEFGRLIYDHHTNLVKLNQVGSLIDEMVGLFNMTQLNIEELLSEQLEKGTSSLHSVPKMLDVCPQVYMGSYFGLPVSWTDGFRTQNCSKKPFKAMVTILINLVDEVNVTDIDVIFNGFDNGSYFDLPVVMMINSMIQVQKQIAKRKLNVKTTVHASYSDGIATKYLTALAVVKTKYVLIARDLIMIDQLVSLERYQFTSRVPQIFYLSLFTFLMTETDKSTLIVVCPDVMLYTNTTGLETMSFVQREDMVEVARRWQLNSIDLHGAGEATIRHDFNYTEVDMHCKRLLRSISRNLILNTNPRNMSGFNGGLILPPCCIEDLANLLTKTLKILDDHEIPYQLDSGTALGACKMQSTMPWELDHDIIVHSKSFDKLFTLKGVFHEAGLRTRHKLCIPKDNCQFNNFFVFSKLSWMLEIFSDYASGRRDFSIEFMQSKISAEIPPTRVLVDGYWALSRPSPGFYCRNRFGYSIYKHAEHWRNTGKSHSYAQYDTSKWLKCPFDAFHGCLDGNMPTSGSLNLLRNP